MEYINICVKESLINSTFLDDLKNDIQPHLNKDIDIINIYFENNDIYFNLKNEIYNFRFYILIICYVSISKIAEDINKINNESK